MLAAVEKLVELFPLQLMLAECLFLGKLERKAHFFWYFVPGMIGICLLCYLLPDWAAASQLNIFYALIFVLTVFLFWFSCKNELPVILFCCSGAYAVQHLAFNTECVFYILREQKDTELLLFNTGLYVYGNYDIHSYGGWSVLLNVLIYCLVYGLCYLFFIRRLEKTDLMEFHSLERVLLGLGIIVFTFGASAIFCCIMVLTIQFGMIEKEGLERSKIQMEMMMELAKRQQEMTKENIDIINIKCHDLRKQVDALKYFPDQSETIQEIKDAIHIYDSVVKTGNDALDIVLTEKSLVCEKSEIRFTYMIDGQSMNFMQSADIFALFGNALDNAIEEVKDTEDVERRIITLNVKQRNGLLLIFMDNYCGKTLHFQNGLPVTTKKDRNYHGFGTKSIVYIAEKYHGSAKMYQEEDRFCLDVRIPIAE